PGRRDPPAAPRRGRQAETGPPETVRLCLPAADQAVQPETELREEPREPRRDHRRARGDSPRAAKDKVERRRGAESGSARVPRRVLRRARSASSEHVRRRARGRSEKAGAWPGRGRGRKRTGGSCDENKGAELT